MTTTRFITAIVSTDMRPKPPVIRIKLDCEGETETVTATFRPSRIGETPDERAENMLKPRFQKTAIGFVGMLADADDQFPDEELSDVLAELAQASKDCDSNADRLLEILGVEATR